MPATIGVLVAEGISSAIVEEHRIAGSVHHDIATDLANLPAEQITARLCEAIRRAAGDFGIDAVGLAFPGVVTQSGIVAESPNYPQMKGCHLRDDVRKHFDGQVCVAVSNDADSVAAGIAATRKQLNRLIRVWTLGNGIGYGRYPSGDEVWEGGHTVVSLDPRERFCGCGGVGHLEGILGHRAMRLRFLDLEPEEVFEQKEPRCVEFVKLWHRALAAATASSIHMEGPGKFYVTGPGAKFLNLGLLHQYVADMVKMSTLQEYVFEVLTDGAHDAGIVGAVVTAKSGTGMSRAAAGAA